MDCTFGRGGHSQAILQQLNDLGRLCAIDKDPEARKLAETAFAGDDRCSFFHGSFREVGRRLVKRNLSGKVDGVFFDLGVSSPQLDDPLRGFSFNKNGPLDMRMNTEQGMTAAEWINQADEGEMMEVLRTLGEERYARRIAKAIVATRINTPVERTQQLADLIRRCVPTRERNKHPATRTFQAIRIHINDELVELREALSQVIELLTAGGRLAVISFHSLEDRIVKRFIREQANPDPYPEYLPISQQAIKPVLRAIGRAIKPGENEIDDNPRSRSAVLRVAEKLPE